MKVYITFNPDGYNGAEIDKVFTSEAAAQDHVIATMFSGNRYYADKEKHELEEDALEYIEVHEVIGTGKEGA